MANGQEPLQADKNTRATPTLMLPINKVSIDAPFRWLKLGWEDFRRVPKLSLGYGIVMALISVLITWSAWQTYSFVLALALIAGFFFLGPVFGIGLYSISHQLQQDITPGFKRCLNEGLKNLNNKLILSLIFLVIFLIWARAASMVHIFFPSLGDIAIYDLIRFLLIGSAVGAVFATVVFCIGAFSIPLMMDRDTDAITAIINSMTAVLNNRMAMLVWGKLIVTGILLGILTGFIGLAITLPIIGHATWHAYQEVMG